MRPSIPLVLGHWFLCVSAYNLFTSPDALVPNKKYDYVIVGGGTAGSVLAARLTENPKINVLVVEAGGTVDDVLNVHIPYFAGKLLRSSVDWNFTSTPQAGLNNRTINLARGYILGGSSCINQMAWHRPSNGSWDYWAEITQDASLSWDAVEEYWLKVSRIVPPVDGHVITGEYVPAAHGNGPVNTTLSSYNDPLYGSIIKTSQLSGPSSIFHFNEDLNAGDNLGWSWHQSATGGGERSCASTAYLVPLESTRGNLDVLINTQATRLLNVAKHGASPELRTVELAQNAASARVQVTASNEVLLSAGFVGTPKILKLSGVGPKAELKSLGIDVVLDAPDVGAGLKDHVLLPLYWRSNTNQTLDDFNRNPTLLQEALNQWLTSRTGQFVNAHTAAVAYARVPDGFPTLRGQVDPANGPGSGHLEIIALDGFLQLTPIPLPSTGYYMTFIAGLVAPLSEGAITLSSSDPFEYPLINPNFLTHEFDQAAILQVTKDIIAFTKLAPFSDLVGDRFGPFANATTDADLLAYAREYSASIDHGSRTARMSPCGAKWGVVDPDYKVKGVKGLRIVDASVFPTIPNVHTQVAVYILAERAAALIQKGL